MLRRKFICPIKHYSGIGYPPTRHLYAHLRIIMKRCICITLSEELKSLAEGGGLSSDCHTKKGKYFSILKVFVSGPDAEKFTFRLKCFHFCIG